jgi:quinol monooxygenase YgiN
MPSIRKGSEPLTLINVFTVEPARQRELASLLERATTETMCTLDGFISASIHRSLDGKRVINYAQWRDQAAFAAMQQRPEAQVHMKAAAALASFDPILCEVSSATDR